MNNDLIIGENFIELKAIFSWQNCFVVVDTESEIGCRMIDDMHISVKYKVFANSDCVYKAIIYTFNKKYRNIFLKTIALIPNKAIVCGYSDYKLYCNKFIKGLLEDGKL